LKNAVTFFPSADTSCDEHVIVSVPSAGVGWADVSVAAITNPKLTMGRNLIFGDLISCFELSNDYFSIYS
jgi:hypothetical protein